MRVLAARYRLCKNENTVGIVICPGSWRYCASFMTPGSIQGFKFDAEKDISIEWEDLKALVKQKGLEAYKIYLDRLDSSIEKDFQSR